MINNPYTIKINYNSIIKGTITQTTQLGYDHTGLVVGASTDNNRFRFYTDDADQIFFDQTVGNPGAAGTRIDPFDTWTNAKAGITTESVITQLDATLLTVDTIDFDTQADLGKKPQWNGSALTAQLCGYIIESNVTMNLSTVTKKAINCTIFKVGVDLTFTQTQGKLDKCIIEKCVVNCAGQAIVNSEFIERVNDNTYLIMTVANNATTTLHENNLYTRVEFPATPATGELYANYCTAISTLNDTITFKAPDQAIWFQQCIVRSENNHGIFADTDSLMWLLGCEIVAKTSGKEPLSNISGGILLWYQSTIIGNIDFNYAGATDASKLTIKDTIIHGDITNSGSFNPEWLSGNHQFGFLSSGINKTQNVYDVDPMFRDYDNDDYRLSHVASGQSLNSPLIGRGIYCGQVFGTWSFYSCPSDMGAYDMDYSALTYEYSDSLELPKTSNKIQRIETTQYSDRVGESGAITIYYNPDTRKETLVLNFPSLINTYFAKIDHLREFKNTNVGISFGELANTSGTVETDGGEAVGAISITINEADLEPGLKVYIEGKWYFILRGSPSWSECTELVLDRDLEDAVADAVTLNTSRTEFEDWKYLPETLNKNRDIEASDLTQSGAVLKFVRQKI